MPLPLPLPLFLLFLLLPLLVERWFPFLVPFLLPLGLAPPGAAPGDQLVAWALRRGGLSPALLSPPRTMRVLSLAPPPRMTRLRCGLPRRRELMVFDRSAGVVEAPGECTVSRALMLLKRARLKTQTRKTYS